MELSGTARGTYGALENTDGAAIARVTFYEADKQVMDWVDEGADMTLDRIVKLNEILGKDLANNNGVAGKLRGVGEEVRAGSNPMKRYLPGAIVRHEMREFVDWYATAEGEMPPAELAARSFQWLVSIHPFKDANGRTTRMVMDWILRRHGLPAAELAPEANLPAVFGYLEKAEPGTAPVPFLVTVGVLKGIERALQRIIAKGRKE
jgi:Fic family protein